MIEIRPIASNEVAAVQALVVSASNAPYDIAPVAEEKIFGRGIAGNAEQIVAIFERRVAGVAVLSGRFLRLIAVDRELRRRGIGRDLLREAESHLQRTHAEIVVGAEAGNYFTPGVSRSDVVTCAFFESSGYYEKGAATNLHAALDDLASPAHPVRPARPDERTPVVDWVGATFGAIWAFETERAFDREDPTVFLAEAGGNIEGFAAYDANNRGLGSFGPAGVRSSSRNSGVGRDLLLAALVDLRRLGYSRAVIQWAAAHEFYRKVCGAVPGEEFAIYAKPLLHS